MSTEVILGIVAAVLSTIGGLAWNAIQASLANMRDELGKARKDTAGVRADLTIKSDELAKALFRVSSLEGSNLQQQGMIAILQKDNAELRATIEQLNKATKLQGEQIDRLQVDGSKKDEEIDRLKAQNHDLFEANKKLAATIQAYEQFARLMGRDLAVAKGTEPGEHKQPDPEKSDDVKTEGNDNA